MGPGEGKTRPGTTVTVFVNPKHIGMLKDDKLTDMIHLYAELLEVPIYLDPIPKPINAMSAPWHREAASAEFRQFVADRYPNDSILDIIPIEISEDDGKFKVGGVLFVPKQPLFIVKEHGDVIVYVRRMYVCKDERTLLPDWAKFVKGVIESPNLRETTSREAILHDENFERVQRALGRAILDYLTRVASDNPRLFKEIVTNHNLVIKAWAIASDELFDRIKDIVLFTTDAGTISLPRYFEMSRYSKGAAANGGKRHIFYFTTPGGAGQHTMLFAAKGLRVIDAQNFPDEGFLQKYANRHEDVILRRLDVGGDFIFEELERRERKWVELEEVYLHQRIDAKVVRFLPEDIPAVLIFPETEPVSDQVDGLLADPNLSAPLKNLVKQMWDDREKQRRGRISAGGILYVNANNPVIQKLADLDLSDYEVQDVMIVIYNNALMLSTQGARMYLAPESAKKIFESNNRTIGALMTKIYEVRELKAHQLVEMGERAVSQLSKSQSSDAGARAAAASVATMAPSVEQTKHIQCLVALPFDEAYTPVLEALRDVLEVAPYFWQVVRADKRYFKNDVSNNLAAWVTRAHCYVVDISELNENVMMELGLMYWAYPNRPLILVQQEGTQHRVVDLGARFRIKYPWGDPPNQESIAAALRGEIKKFDDIMNLKGEAHYLSPRLMRADFIQPKLANALAERFETVEELLAREPGTISRDLGSRIAPTGVVESVQEYLRDVCGIR